MGRVTGLVNGICRATCPGCIPHGSGKLDSLRYIFAIMIAIMSDRLRMGLIVIVAGVLLAAAAWWALPQLAAANEALSGLLRAFTEQREVIQADLLRAASDLVPLYRTYEERIKALRTWSRHRARPAGSTESVAELLLATQRPANA